MDEHPLHIHTNVDGKVAAFIDVKGLVQGVGFRPFVYRLAIEHALNGWVRNTNKGVEIHAEGSENNIETFTENLKIKAPVAAIIESVHINREQRLQHFNDFNIRSSENLSNEISIVSPDIAVCSGCLADLKTQKHRIQYPLTNCTNCGPRFSIIKDLPYDRDKTTMCEFEMCPACTKEYNNILNRRFHAQPVACNHCGPVYTLHGKNSPPTDFEGLIQTTRNLIDNGKIVTIKGLGGFNLACNALDNNAVKRLRDIKNREGKPFAVMFRDIIAVKEFAHVNHQDEKLLTSWQNPIVILKLKKELAPLVSNEFSTVGAFLPYTPLHHILFEQLKTPAIVLTSANISNEPIIIDNAQALKLFNDKTNAVLENNRAIYNRTDDSVCQTINNSVQILRRSRGYAPLPIKLNINTEGIFAAGAELNNCFCLGKGNYAILSQHIGDLKNYETFEFYVESIVRFKKLFKFEPTIVAHDLHPDYLSTKHALELGLETIGIQHHHAHIAAVIAEHGIEDKVIGISLDGTGYGTDGNIWGGEVLISDLNDFKRITHFKYTPMPGGDIAVKHPWRMAASYLNQTFGTDWTNLKIPFIDQVKQQTKQFDLFIKMLDKHNAFPLSSSAGRLFDAISALIGTCTNSTFHAEAPMRLEDCIRGYETEAPYDYILDSTIDFSICIKQIVDDLQTKTNPSIIAAKFHNTVVNAILNAALIAQQQYGTDIVVLGGGVFQNKYLIEKTFKVLSKNGFRVFTGNTIPVNDGGLALGQLIIAANKRTQ